MADITRIDKNFAVSVTVKRESLCYYDIEQKPFRIYGVKKEKGKFRRMPEAVVASVGEGVYSLHTNTAGGRVRFVTDSHFVAVLAEIEGIAHFGHMTPTGIAGLDMSVFIYDYDNNAPTLEHLKASHEKMFKAVREVHPTLPVIMMPRPKYYLNSDEKERAEIVRATYDDAVAAGDKNVYPCAY